MAMSFTRRQAITAGAGAVAAGALVMTATTGASISADKAPEWLTLLGRKIELPPGVFNG